MSAMFIALLGPLIGAGLLKYLESKIQVVQEHQQIIEAKMESIKELEWLPESWNDPEYVNMIHTTRAKEQEAFGYIVSPCLCSEHKPEFERQQWLDNYDYDVDKINAATRAVKEQTERIYYVTMNDPAWRGSVVDGIRKGLSVPEAIMAEDRSASNLRDIFVPDPYSAQMRLKEEIFVLEKRMTKAWSYGSKFEYMRLDKELKLVKQRLRKLQNPTNPMHKNVAREKYAVYADGEIVSEHYV